MRAVNRLEAAVVVALEQIGNANGLPCLHIPANLCWSGPHPACEPVALF
jgi:hypothetical protein